MNSSAAVRCAAVLLLSSLAAFAGETKVSKDEVPEPVLKAAQARYPGASMKRFSREEEHGHQVFEIVLSLGKQRIESSFLADGRWLEDEVEVAPAELPEPIRKAMSEGKYKGATITHAERATKDGKPPVFELDVLVGNSKLELVFDETGRLQREKAEGASGD
jgi:hypothetical protein